MRYKSVYVIAAKEKVILDFEVTNRLPTTATPIPLSYELKIDFQNTKYKKSFQMKIKQLLEL